MEQGKANEHVGIFMNNLHELIPNIDGNGQFLGAFPGKGLLHGLSRLYFTAYKFPQQSPCLMGRTLANQKTVAVPNERRYHFCSYECRDKFIKSLTDGSRVIEEAPAEEKKD